jgi:hypothetical protein
MQRLRNILACALLAVLIVAGVYGVLFIRATTAVVAAVPGEIQATRSALTQEVQATRKDLMEQVAGVRRDAVGQLSALQTNAGQQMTDLRGDVMARLDKIESDTNTRVGDTLGRVDVALGVANARLGEITATAAGMRSDLKPALVNSASLVKDLQDSLDDNYYDLKATIGSSTVAVTGIARAAEAVGNAAPSITKSVDGIAKSAAREADGLTKPPTFFQGLKSWLLVVSRCAGFFL